MARFAALPSDVLAIIFQELSLGDLISVGQVCTTIHEAISTDKLLWMNIFERYVINGGKCAIPYRRPMSLVDAMAVESWTRNAFVLERAYLSMSPLSVHCLKTGIRAVTWVKIIRGRWCLTASSNTSESRLALWDILSSDDRICAEIILPGPVMNGEIEDLNSEIIIAISVGCRERYVQILKVGTHARVPQILKLTTIPGADQVLCLRGSYLGLAVVDGDDSNPILLDWKRGTQWAMKPSVPISFLPEIHSRSTCLAMTIWDAFVVVAFPRHLRVYSCPDNHGGGCELLRTHWVLDGVSTVIQVRFVSRPFQDDVERSGATHLHIFFNIDNGDIDAQALDANGQLLGSRVFEYFLPRPAEQKKIPVDMLWMTIGYTGRKLLGLISSMRHCLPPRLLLASIRPSQSQAFCDLPCWKNEMWTDYRIIHTANFPLLHFWPCFDFDDSRGVLLTGTSRGEICVARFVRGDIILPGSLMDELPPLQAKDTEKELLLRSKNHPVTATLGIFQVPVMTDLPSSYQFRECIMNGDIPAHVVDQITSFWKLPGDVQVSAPGWSNDWHGFRNLKLWAIPSFRWGLMDPNLSTTQFLRESLVNGIRISYGYLGEPYPVAFLQENHDVVIFRIGAQVFLKLQRDEYGTCYPFALFRQPPQELSQLLQTISVHDLSNHHLLYIPYWGDFFNISDEALLQHVWDFDYILQHAAMSDDFAMDPNPNNWTPEQWNEAQEWIEDARHSGVGEIFPTSDLDLEAGSIDDYSDSDEHQEENESV